MCDLGNVQKTDGAVARYTQIASRISERFKLVDAAYSTGRSPAVAESVALHTRKIIEGVAHGCLVAADMTSLGVPRDARGHWNAAKIFRNLKKRGVLIFPQPVVLKPASEEQIELGVKWHFEANREAQMSLDDVIGVYEECHRLLHEINPFVNEDLAISQEDDEGLFQSVHGLSRFLAVHFITVEGTALVASLWDGDEKAARIIHGIAREQVNN